nr:transmembrane protein 45A-like [Ipomoea batatas]
MGNLMGHVLPGLGFFLVGLWHLLNQVKRHASHPKTYFSLPWFPSPRFKYLELYVIMAGSLASISMELFVSPARHTLFDPDGTIPSNHLRKLEHAGISATILLYAVSTLVLDLASPPAKHGLTLFIGAVALGQELLLFHLHSTDHIGVEGQYHWLLQLAIFISFCATILGIPFPSSFLTSLARSFGMMLQGGWMIAMGILLWTPGLISKGCFINDEDGHQIVRCHTVESMERAKSLANIQFSWSVNAVAILVLSIYLVCVRKVEEDYERLSKECEDEKELIQRNVEAQINLYEKQYPKNSDY